MLFIEHGIPVHHDLIPLNGYYFTGILVHKILTQVLQYTERRGVCLHICLIVFFSPLPHRPFRRVQDVLVGFITDRTQQVVTGNFFFRSMYAYITLLMSVANSIQDPLKGITRAE
jgi:hypothetical protein